MVGCKLQPPCAHATAFEVVGCERLDIVAEPLLDEHRGFGTKRGREDATGGDGGDERGLTSLRRRGALHERQSSNETSAEVPPLRDHSRVCLILFEDNRLGYARFARRSAFPG
jgi:hypothetical protein